MVLAAHYLDRLTDHQPSYEMGDSAILEVAVV